MSDVKDTNSFTIHAWMATKLKLSGNELLLYALIFTFSQDGKSEFFGSRSYLSDFINASKRTVDGVLTSLQEKGLIKKRVQVTNGVTNNFYSVCDEEIAQGVQKLQGDGAEVAPKYKEEYKDKENIKRNENIVQPSFLANDENQVQNEKVDLETATPTSTSSLIATNEQQSSQQKANKGTDTIVISALNDIYTKIEFMYKKCGYKDKLAKKDTITRLKTICNNTNKSKRLHPLQILLSYGAYLAECRKYGKDVQYVKQSNFFLTSMVYDYSEKTASDFEQRVVEKYGDGWKKYKVVD